MRAAGGDVICVSSQDEEKKEIARERTGAVDMTFIADYDKTFAPLYGLLILPQEKGDEWHHKDKTMTQPGIFVINSEGDTVYSWVSDKPGPFGRPEPLQFWSGLAKALAKHGPGIDKKSLTPFLNISYMGPASFAKKFVTPARVARVVGITALVIGAGIMLWRATRSQTDQ